MRAPTLRTWGSTLDERRRRWPCDDLLPDADTALFRAIDVEAPPALLWAWVCQLRAAPYSYDLVDNLGRRSPRVRDPANLALAVGQPVMSIFRVVSFSPGRQLTIRADRTLFGAVAITYEVVPRDGGSRLRAKVLARGRRRWSHALQPLLPFGDFVMMRKQLRTLKALAEREAHARTHAIGPGPVAGA